MEFLRSFLRRHFTGKPVLVSRNVGCFLRVRWVIYACANATLDVRILTEWLYVRAIEIYLQQC